MKKVTAFVFALSLAAATSGCGALWMLGYLSNDSTAATEATTEEHTTEETTEETTEATTEKTSEVENEITIEHGELLSVIYNKIDGKSVAVVKAKITPSFSNKATISQNFYNVEDLVVNQGFDKYDEIQYWAVADMESGNESKVVSFTVNSETIKLLKDRRIAGGFLDEYLDDLWVLPSLRE